MIKLKLNGMLIISFLIILFLTVSASSAADMNETADGNHLETGDDNCLEITDDSNLENTDDNYLYQEFVKYEASRQQIRQIEFPIKDLR